MTRLIWIYERGKLVQAEDHPDTCPAVPDVREDDVDLALRAVLGEVVRRRARVPGPAGARAAGSAPRRVELPPESDVLRWDTARMAQHEWKRDGKGNVDEFVQDNESGGRGHNGPGCTVCDFNFCMHCWPTGWDQECPGPAPAGFEYDWSGGGSTKDPEEAVLYPRQLRATVS